ncbi:uncharacterized protein LOC118826996 isoform X1 [Colossoma macropomum]|uniref:uncharacterized protein LOC118826996 isoform X1 n=1 Tax=Colossoma macropomum TaxID=42526 RepID=UPI00186553CB|nr:uncharacterized protein LOC118826996 isoform X1 [Colossoma macropomum]XP_036454047.1 uncharacterized protein LOC118826996 isoform X1 [Colossoma macropomum]
MQSCSSALCILILISTFTTLSESCFTSVKVKLHDSAVLPCYGRCSVWGRWTALGNPDDVLAECDQTSCRSVKEGNQMIHDQYLKGNLSLTISDAVFSQRTWYTCKCESHNICDVSVQTEPLSTTVQIKPGESLFLRIEISDPVEIIHNSTDTSGHPSGQICTVDGRSLQCKPEYTQRVFLASALPSVLELRNTTPSDSGEYSIVEKEKKVVIHIYTVTMEPEITCRTQSPRSAGCAHGCLLAGITLEQFKLQT